MTRTLTALALLFASLPAAAQVTYTWTGAGNGNWATAANWDGNGVPVSDLANSDVVFAGTAGLINVVDVTPTPFNIRSLTFDASAGTFNITPVNLTPTTLRIGSGGIIVNSTNAQTISNPLALGADQFWIASTGRLFVDGPVAATGQTLTFDGGNDIRLSQTATVTGGALIKTGGGITTLSANNTPTSVTINQGTLVVNKVGSGSPIGTAPVTLNGGTLSFRVFGNPVAATGYNHDVITAISEFVPPVPPPGTTNGTTRAVDGSNGNGPFVYFQAGANAANPTFGLPANGRFTSGSVDYQFQDYTGLNVLSLGNVASGNTTGTLTLDTPGQYRSLNIMNVAGNGPAAYNITLNFADSTTTNIPNLTSLDWFNGANPVFIVQGRLNRTTSAFANIGQANPRVYTFNYSLNAADQLKTLNSITFNMTGTNGFTFNCFGFSGTAGSNSQTFTNSIEVLSESTIEQLNVGNITVGPLSIGSTTLNTVGDINTVLTMGTATLSGDPTFNIGAGNTTRLGALNDTATPRTINKLGGGTLEFSAPATSFGNGTINLNAGGVAVSAANAIGTQTAFTMFPDTTFNATASVTLKSLAGTGGRITQTPTSALAVNGGTGNTYAGSIGGGPLTVTGALTNLTLTGSPNTPTAITIDNAGKVSASAPSSLGSGPVTLNGTATLSVGGVVAVAGFNNGIGYNAQGSPGFIPSFAGDSVQITNNTADRNGTAWFGSPLPTGPFTASFRYSQSAIGGGADGFTFTIQNESPTALGTANVGGGALAIRDIAPSYSLAINIYGPNVPGYAYTADGVQPVAPYNGIGAISLPNAQAGNEVTFNVTYDGTTMNVTLTQGANVFTLPPQTLPLGTLGNSAYFGFTGATGGVTAAQTIENFIYQATAGLNYANPIALAPAANAGLNVQLLDSPLAIHFGTLTAGAGATLNVGPEAGSLTDIAYSIDFAATTLSGPTATFNIANNGSATGTVTLSDVSGPSQLTKGGNGTLELRGTGTYTNSTFLNAGRLLVSGNYSATPDTFVSNSTLLFGGGSKGGITNVATGGAVQGGDGTAANPTLTLGSLLLNNNSTLRTTLRNGTVASDLTTSGASLVATSSFGRNLPTSQMLIVLTDDGSFDLSGQTTYSRVVATYSTLTNLSPGVYGAGGPFTLTGDNFTVAPGWAVNVNSGAVTVTFAPLPEPALLLGLGALAIVALRRRGGK